jgi:endo-1,4-beta-xylanase
MLKNIVVPAHVAKIAKAAALGLQTAAILSVCVVATAQVSQAQSVRYNRSSPGQSSTTERDYTYSTWASSTFVGWGYVESKPNQEQVFMMWNYSQGGFQGSKGLRAVAPGDPTPDQLYHESISRLQYTNGKGEARFNYTLNVDSAPSGSQIWTGVQGWVQGVEYYIVENLDRGSLPVADSTKVGSVTIDGAAYDLYTRPYQTWRQWWSVRRVKRTSGTVNYVKHFKAWQGLTVPGVTNLVNNATTKLPDVSLLSVSLGVETYGPSAARLWWDLSTVTKPY